MFDDSPAIPTFRIEIGRIEDKLFGTLSMHSFDINFYGPTPDHIVGLVYRYLARRTGGAAFLIDPVMDESVTDLLSETP